MNRDGWGKGFLVPWGPETLGLGQKDQHWRRHWRRRGDGVD